MKRLVVLFSLAALVMSVQAAPKGKEKKSKAKTEKSDTVAKPKPAKGTIEAVIKSDAKISKGGMFTIIEQEGKYYFLMPSSLLERDILVVNRLSKAAAGIRSGFVGYAGDEVQEAMVRFVESPNKDNIFLQNIMTRELPRDTVGDMREAVLRSNFQPIAAAFKIEARNKAKDSILIDATDYINSDNALVSFDPFIKQLVNLSKFQKDKSYIVSVKSFPINVEIKSVKTFMYTPKYGKMTLPEEPATYEVNSSMVLLPKVPMRPRYDDRRVGYFTDNYVDYEKHPQGVKNVSMIARFRLEPKDLDAYKRGELVEPIKPIVYYIDPATPKKWVPYLIQGVNDWQKAFEAAGFKNAIYALEAPTKDQDSTWSLEDARFSAIVYKPSDIPNASGPHVSDPRSGESIETHINWYHNVQNLVRNWYMIQAGPNDVRAQQMIFPDSLMGELIRFVSSHEVGHTLGLRHNMGSTSLVPVDSLRSKTFVEKYGHVPSIMDYSRFNYVVQPEDGIDPKYLNPRINDYDLWAIEFGYRYLPQFATADEEVPFLNQWIIEKNKNPRMWFGHEMNSSDPRSQTEDLGDNQMKANALGIKNLQRVMVGLPQWTKMPNENYSSMGEIYNAVIRQYGDYIGHVAKWVGGQYENPKTIEQGGVVYSYVGKDKQKEAMAWLDQYVFTNPNWIDNKEVFDKTGIKRGDIYRTVYVRAINALLSQRVLNNIIENEMGNGASAYSSKEFFADLDKSVWGNFIVSSSERRILQQVYVEWLVDLLTATETNYRARTSDYRGVVNYQVRNLIAKLKSAQVSDPVVKGHYQALVTQLERVVNANNNLSASN